MEKTRIRKEITDLINSIKEHSDSLAEYEVIPQLELEAILHKIDQLYEKSIVFNYLHSHSENDEIEKEIITISPDSIQNKDTETNVEKENVISEEVLKAEVKDQAIDLFGNELPRVIEKPKPEKKPEKKEEHQATKKITKPAITDIKSAIGINDRFQFTKELFDENSTEYNIAIQHFNTAETIESAMEYFNSLQQLYNWDMENETVKRLLDLVERRYS